MCVHHSDHLPISPTDEVMMEEVDQTAQLRAGELIIIVVVLVMWAGKALKRPTPIPPSLIRP